MLHTFADDIAPSISALFNTFIVHGQLPADWKLSNIVFIPKETGKQDVHFFHPISLLLVISKVPDRHLLFLQKLVPFVNRSKYWTNC